MDKLWTSRIFGRAAKVKIFNSSVKAKVVLLCASESWTVTQRTVDRIQVFIGKCLRSILNIHWPDRITNKELWKKMREQPVLERLRRRKWNWIDHTQRQSDDSSDTVHATRPQRKRTTEKHLEKISGEGNVDSGLQV